MKGNPKILNQKQKGQKLFNFFPANITHTTEKLTFVRYYQKNQQSVSEVFQTISKYSPKYFTKPKTTSEKTFLSSLFKM